jgi:hypothetical protein
VTPREQRRSRRYPADWSAQYRLDPNDEWRYCRVVDVSFDGASLELTGATAVEGLVGPIHLQISSVAGDQVGVSIRAVIRRHVQLDGRVIVGVEFSVLRDEERNLLHLLVGLRAQS